MEFSRALCQTLKPKVRWSEYGALDPLFLEDHKKRSKSLNTGHVLNLFCRIRPSRNRWRCFWYIQTPDLGVESAEFERGEFSPKLGDVPDLKDSQM